MHAVDSLRNDNQPLDDKILSNEKNPLVETILIFFPNRQVIWYRCSETFLDTYECVYVSLLFKSKKATARQIYGSKEKCLFNYSTNTLFYKDLFFTIINYYNQDFVKSAIFQRKVLISERLFVLQNKIYYKSCR
jgi:hypothetical protein